MTAKQKSEATSKLGGLRAFFGETVVEARKCTWPPRQELIGSTVVVIVSVVLLSLFVALSDKILMELLKLIVPAS